MGLLTVGWIPVWRGRSGPPRKTGQNWGGATLLSSLTPLSGDPPHKPGCAGGGWEPRDLHRTEKSRPCRRSRAPRWLSLRRLRTGCHITWRHKGFSGLDFWPRPRNVGRWGGSALCPAAVERAEPGPSRASDWLPAAGQAHLWLYFQRPALPQSYPMCLLTALVWKTFPLGPFQDYQGCEI